MLRFYLVYFIGPFVAAVAAGLLFVLSGRRRSQAAPSRVHRRLAAAGVLIAFAFVLVPFVIELSAWFLPSSTLVKLAWELRDTPVKYALPLVSGLIAVALMACGSAQPMLQPIVRDVGPSSRVPEPLTGEYTEASLMRRSTFAFARRNELIWIGVLALAAVGVALAAGRVSLPDEAGRYRMYEVDAGVQRGATEIYGWHFSSAALVSMLLLLLAALVALWRIAKPPFETNTGIEFATRKLRSDWVTRTVIAALLVHLGDVSRFLSASASLRMSSMVAGGGPMLESWPKFAALGPALQVIGYGLGFLGIALWSTVFWRSALGASRGRG